MPVHPVFVEFVEPYQKCSETVYPSKTPFVYKPFFIDLRIEESLSTFFDHFPVPCIFLDIWDHLPTLYCPSK